VPPFPALHIGAASALHFSVPDNQAPKENKCFLHGHGIRAGATNLLILRRFVVFSAVQFAADIAYKSGKRFKCPNLRAAVKTAIVNAARYAHLAALLSFISRHSF